MTTSYGGVPIRKIPKGESGTEGDNAPHWRTSTVIRDRLIRQRAISGVTVQAIAKEFSLRQLHVTRLIAKGEDS